MSILYRHTEPCTQEHEVAYPNCLSKGKCWTEKVWFVFLHNVLSKQADVKLQDFRDKSRKVFKNKKSNLKEY